MLSDILNELLNEISLIEKDLLQYFIASEIAIEYYNSIDYTIEDFFKDCDGCLKDVNYDQIIVYDSKLEVINIILKYESEIYEYSIDGKYEDKIIKLILEELHKIKLNVCLN